MNGFTKILLGKKERSPAEARETCGKRAGLIGILFNVLLAAAKLTFGVISGAVSVVADGLNNLTDCGSNAVSVIGFKMSGKPADAEHPFGHKRAETVSALVVSVIVLVVAVELLVQSFERIFSPEKSDFSYAVVIVLVAAVAVKLFMFWMNRSLSKSFSSEALRATAADSLSDAAATTAVLISMLISHYTKAELDGYMGILVALFIAFSGFSILKDAVSKLLGKSIDAETVKEIETRIRNFEDVRGVHDLLIHDYGADTLYASVHVEVDSKMSITAAHDLADRIEKKFDEEGAVRMTVHIDPLVYGDARLDALRALAQEQANKISPELKLHDFRAVGGAEQTNLVFEIAAPFDCKLSNDEIGCVLKNAIRKADPHLDAVITVERQNLS